MSPCQFLEMVMLHDAKALNGPCRCVDFKGPHTH